MDEGMPASAALAEMDRVAQAVRHRSRWYGRFLLALGAGTVVYYAGIEAADRRLPAVIGLMLCWLGFVLALVLWAERQPVWARDLRPWRWPLFALYFATVSGTVALSATVWAGQPGRWVLGVIPAVPCAVGAWVVLRR
ncbi:hypothetical protein HNP84_009499 [Thermocatellispora tengchongensis]|uniref:Uncharacterized protein n=1 Tax=Thermocatellispora tengchongensis TaxID=1073253 RepID=A0A840PV18_9ACTN|nr:hypothetical protein [Thermocatellispora tengchongensis]MBB5139735.1 hypothetical protein [Thermocatellispora tengchongensis]